MSAKASTPIDGVCDDRFAAVRDAFAGNFAQHDEIGAAVTLYVRGRKVVERGRHLARDSVARRFRQTLKGLLAA